jgi:hypothetical protein
MTESLHSRQSHCPIWWVWETVGKGQNIFLLNLLTCPFTSIPTMCRKNRHRSYLLPMGRWRTSQPSWKPQESKPGLFPLCQNVLPLGYLPMYHSQMWYHHRKSERSGGRHQTTCSHSNLTAQGSLLIPKAQINLCTWYVQRTHHTHCMCPTYTTLSYICYPFYSHTLLSHLLFHVQYQVNAVRRCIIQWWAYHGVFRWWWIKTSPTDGRLCQLSGTRRPSASS